MTNKHLTAVTLLLPALALAAACMSASAMAGCNPHAQKRVVKGKQPTADTLYAHIQHVGAGSWQAGFDTETFVYVGDVHAKSGKIYKVGHLHTIAMRKCIAFDRLFIFDAKDNYLGQYAPVEVDSKKIKIKGSTLIFPFDTKGGNKLDLKDGPPANIRLDGDDIGWEPALAPGTAPPP